jgi:hypothetical protein
MHSEGVLFLASTYGIEYPQGICFLSEQSLL